MYNLYLGTNGERTEGAPHLLQGQEVLKAHGSQGHAVQGRQGLKLCAGQAPLRLEAGWFWRSNQARLPQEGASFLR